MAGLGGDQLTIAKTVKLFIGGEFPRTESGRTYPVMRAKGGGIYAHLCLASRKDLRQAVTAAKEAQDSWAKRSAYNRGQILYRMAEMLEGKRQEMSEVLTLAQGLSESQSQKEVDLAIAALVYYAGFTDKYQQLIGSVNPVSGPHHNFTTPEALGVVGILFAKENSLMEFVSAIAAVIASGNAVLAVMVDDSAVVISCLAEVFATSDLPKGVINLLSGRLEELYSHLGTHMEVQGLAYLGEDGKIKKELQVWGAENVKRLVMGPATWRETRLENILQFIEYKTVWHPVSF